MTYFSFLGSAGAMSPAAPSSWILARPSASRERYGSTRSFSAALFSAGAGFAAGAAAFFVCGVGTVLLLLALAGLFLVGAAAPQNFSASSTGRSDSASPAALAPAEILVVPVQIHLHVAVLVPRVNNMTKTLTYSCRRALPGLVSSKFLPLHTVNLCNLHAKGSSSQVELKTSRFMNLITSHWMGL